MNFLRSVYFYSLDGTVWGTPPSATPRGFSFLLCRMRLMMFRPAFVGLVISLGTMDVNHVMVTATLTKFTWQWYLHGSGMVRVTRMRVYIAWEKRKEKDLAVATEKRQDEKKRHGNDGKGINVYMYICRATATHRWRTMHRRPWMTLL